MKKIMNTKTIAIITAIIIILQCLSLTAFALNDGELYKYVFDDGVEVYYYLDEYNMPYNYENGIRVNLILPLEHLKVTDPTTLSALEEKFKIDAHRDVSLKAPPTSYYSLLKNDVHLQSNIYTQFMTFEANSTIPTSVMCKYQNHLAIHVKTLNVGKEHFYNSNKVTIKLFYYHPMDDCYYNYTHSGVDATDAIGDVFNLKMGGLSYFMIQMEKYKNNVIWFDLNVYTTTA